MKSLLFLLLACPMVFGQVATVQTVTEVIQPVPLGRTKPSAVVLTSSPNPGIVGQPLSFTAVVEGYPGGPTPTGQVQFLLNGQVVQTETLINGGVTCEGPAPSAGTYKVTLKYLGDGNYLPQ